MDLPEFALRQSALTSSAFGSDVGSSHHVPKVRRRSGDERRSFDDEARLLGLTGRQALLAESPADRLEI